MKARIIKTKDSELRLLCEDGTLATCSKVLLFDFLTNFRTANFSDGKAGRWDMETPDMVSGYYSRVYYRLATARALRFRTVFFRGIRNAQVHGVSLHGGVCEAA